MKLAFSTLGCPRWTLDKIIRSAGSYGFQGVEVRGLQDDLDITRRAEFTTGATPTLRQLRDNDVEIACFSSSVMLSNSDTGSSEKSLDELTRYAELCVAFETPYIRIFGGSIGSVPRQSALETAITELSKMADIARDAGIAILVETHDDWMRADHMKSLMTAVSSDAIGLLWDVNHPFMFLGEAPATTWRETGAWVRHTHWKDSKRNPRAKHGFEPVLMGDGDLPHQEIYEVLKGGSYSGYLSLEWEKRWHPEIPEPEVAFPQYVEYMKKLL
ncbi:MAG: sugar phosphate isomerase/epimerase [Bacteroidetes bacterium]|jgi:sugar phosphate isomerase/epimerase|nr:sugar phosphate isomerase/epimerase [Bacteroidota bacterium]